MRTAAADHVTLLGVVPAVMPTVTSDSGPTRPLEAIDAAVIDGLRWVRSQW